MNHMRAVCLLCILAESTDRQGGLTLPQLRRRLEEQYRDLCCEQTVRRELAELHDFFLACGLPLRLDRCHGPHNRVDYRLYPGDFDLNDARMALQAVAVSPFFTVPQKNRLMETLGRGALLSQRELRELKRQVRTRRSPVETAGLPENLNVIYRAIDQEKCLSFQYHHLELDGRRGPGSLHTDIQPIQVVWEDERFYLAARNPAHHRPGEDPRRNYRIDRMTEMRLSPGAWEEVDRSTYRFGQFEMFPCQVRETVTCRVQRRLLDVCYETFGTLDACRPDPERRDWVRFRTEMEISGGFDRWVLRQGDGLEVLDPPWVRERIRSALKKTLKQYEET